MIPLTVPNLGGREAQYLEDCVRTGFVSSVGPYVRRLEEMVAAETGARRAVATASGTCALHLALHVAGVRPGDLVIVPSFTFIATANAVSHCGAVPWILDVDPGTWTLSEAAVEDALTRQARKRYGQLVHTRTGRRIAAIVPVYTLGAPGAALRIKRLADRAGIPVVADAAAAIGARIEGSPLAGAASLSILSFNGNKTVTAGGGGMIFGDDEALLERCHHLSTTARRGPDYDHDEVGFNYRMTNLQAAVGCAQMERLAALLAAKRRIRAAYDRALGARPGFAPFPAPEGTCWLSGVVVLDEELPQPAEIRKGLAEAGVQAGLLWKPVHLQTPYAGAPRGPLAATEALWHRVLVLPCSTGLAPADQERVIAALAATLERRPARAVL